MARRAASLLLLALLVAGCFEEPAASPPEAGFETTLDILPEDLPLPTPEPIPVPPPPTPANATRPDDSPPEPRHEPSGETRVLHHGPRAAGAASARFAVPGDVAHLRLVLDVEGARWEGVVELRAPDGATMAACLAAPCEAFVDGPVASGEWVLVFPPHAPADLVATVVATLDKIVSEPPPLPLEPVHRLLYERSREFGDAPMNRSHTDAFAVPAGYDRLVVKVHTERPIAPGLVRIQLMDAAWRPRGACDASEERCVLDVAAPLAGLWRLNYTGDTPARSNVTAYGLSGSEVPLPPNMTVQDTTHHFQPEAGSAVTGGFYAVPGYKRILLSFTFDHPLPYGSGDRPVVVLYEPGGKAWRCEPATGLACPFEVPAFAGRWAIASFGPGSGSVRIEARLDPANPEPPRETPPAAPPTGPTQFYMRDVRYAGSFANHTDWLSAYSTASRFTGFFYLDTTNATGGPTPAVRLYDPSGRLAHECVGEGKRTCPVNVSVTQAGRWHVHFAGNATGWARASLNHSDEAGYVPREGHHATAYEGGHAYYSSPYRGNFTEGFAILPGWKRVTLAVEFEKVAADDGKGTAYVTLRAPDGKLVGTCSFKPAMRNCTLEAPAQLGLWEIGYLGRDSSSHARVVARTHG